MPKKRQMHPGNIYKNPPNFRELAIAYPEFRKYVKQELSGRVTIDFQDQNAIKELTRALLKKDFNLNVEIAEERLIPRVPLCLNYILWIEDLLRALNLNDQPFGIDIGTGSVCIYSLLAAKKGWKMLATEVDPVNFKSAEKNVHDNNFQEVITVKLVPDSGQLLLGVIDDQIKYDFCMCNPPFFDHNEKPQNRTLRRPQIETIASNVPVEISTEGGEVAFIKRIIEESVKLQDKVKIYTTLIGKRSDFSQIKKEVQKISPKSLGFTEFCQGKITRWGVAWSFLDVNLNTKQNSELHKAKKTKSKPPLSFVLLGVSVEKLNEVFENMKKVLNDLKISFHEESCELGHAVSFKAYKNTWSHQRRKKRLKARIEECKLEERTEEEEVTQSGIIQIVEDDDGDDYSECSTPKRLRLDTEVNQKFTNSDASVNVEGLISLRSENLQIFFQITWISGSKEYLHQIFQYFKNYWKDSSHLSQNNN